MALKSKWLKLKAFSPPTRNNIINGLLGFSPYLLIDFEKKKLLSDLIQCSSGSILEERGIVRKCLESCCLSVADASQGMCVTHHGYCWRGVCVGW